MPLHFKSTYLMWKLYFQKGSETGFQFSSRLTINDQIDPKKIST